MPASQSISAGGRSKRAVNLTLSESLVSQTKMYTKNLSATVEMLLAGYVADQIKGNLQKANDAQAQSAAWNLLNDQIGSFADEYSSL